MNKVDFLREFIDVIFNKKHLDEVPKYIHPAYEVRLDTADPWEGKTLSHEVFKERLAHTNRSFPDINFEVLHVIPDENDIAITWIMRGTNTGAIGEYPATNKQIYTTGMTIYHFKEGKIAGHSQVFERLRVWKQLGFM